MLDFTGKRILVVGMARSGRAAARFLARRGAVVTGTDIKERGEFGAALRELESLPINLVLGGYPEVDRGLYDLVIISPGVPPAIPPVACADRAGIPVWSELELASRFIEDPVIAVTGTNGKTTTTSLIGYILKKAGKQVAVAGNIGVPLIGEVEKALQESRRRGFWVVEVSSFQLERVREFHPDIAVLLNVTPDHLDRHGTMEEYARVKYRVFQNQTADDWAILNLDDPWISGHRPETSGQSCWFSRRLLPEGGIGAVKGMLCYHQGDGWIDLCPVAKVRIPGPHNLENALAAAAAALKCGISREVVAEALASFPGVPHRLEPVGTVRGVRYVNDSKGTNPESVLKALDSFEEPIILIAGGRHKGSDLNELAVRIKEKVKALVLLGEAAPLIKQAVRAVGYEQIHMAGSLEEAVRSAAQLACEGDVVLLSPACASWDMFRDYEERGDLFRKLVHEL